MPFGIPKEGFWGKIELAYQHCHMFYGFWFSLLLLKIYGEMFIPAFSGLLLGIIMECVQYWKYIQTKAWPRTWKDCIRDLIFWWIGGMLAYVFLLI